MTKSASFFDCVNEMPVHEALLAYLDKGITVFPLRPDDPKVPAVRWKQYQTSTPTVFEARRWIEQWPDMTALAIATGTHNNLYALDTDNEAAERWVRENAPATPLQAITRKGQHFFYLPGLVKFSIGVSIGPDHLRPGPGESTGIDYRGETGYVVAAPSVVKGFTYRWEYEPAGAPIPTLDALGEAFFCTSGRVTARKGRMAPQGGTNAAGGQELAYTPAGLVAIGCRDFYMRDLVMGIIASNVQEVGDLPSAKFVAETAWRRFQQNCDMSDDVPKFEHCLQKAEYTLRRIKAGTLVIHNEDAEIGDAEKYEEQG